MTLSIDLDGNPPALPSDVHVKVGPLQALSTATRHAHVPSRHRGIAGMPSQVDGQEVSLDRSEMGM